MARVLFSAARIRRRVAAVGGRLTRDYAGRPLTVLVISNGAIFFAADLLRAIRLPLELDMVGVASYIGTHSGKLLLRFLPKLKLAGRDVLIVDDIYDTGRTLGFVAAEVRKRRPASVRTCVLLCKDRPRATPGVPDYVAFHVGPEFVVGYGLDFEERYRNVPYVGVLRRHRRATVRGAGHGLS
jgi:hypoxanthine phosphoribosyltransferase